MKNRKYDRAHVLIYWVTHVHNVNARHSNILKSIEHRAGYHRRRTNPYDNYILLFLFTCAGGKVLRILVGGGARETRHFSNFNFQASCRAAGNLNLCYYRQQRRKLVRDKIDGHQMVCPVSLVIGS